MRHKSLPRAQKGKIVKTTVKKIFNISDDEIAKGVENIERMAERARLKERFKAIDKADKGVKSSLIPKKKMGGMYLNGGDTTKTKPLYPQAVPPRTPTKRPNITKSVDNYIRNPRPDKAPSIKKMGGSTLPKAQLGRTIKKAVKAVTKEYNIPRSVGRTEKSYVNYYPKKEWHGAEGRKLSKEYRKEKIYGKAALGATLAAGATAGVMMNKKGSSKSEKSKLIPKKK